MKAEDKNDAGISPEAQGETRPLGRKISRKKFLGLCGAGAAVAACAGVASWARWGETSRLTFSEIDIEVPEWAGTNNSARFVVASDFHIAPDEAPRLDAIVAAMRAQQADAFLLLGDFYKGVRHGESLPIDGIVRGLMPLLDSAPAFACLGNHDAYFDNRRTADALNSGGIKTFHPEGAEIFTTRRGEKIVIAGTLDADTYSPENIALPKIPAGAEKLPAVLISHSPDIVENLKERNDFLLTLCGHTHGGQVCLPGGQAIVTSTRCVGLKYVYGLNDAPGGKGKIFTTRGLGTALASFRLFCPPEILIVNLKAPKIL